MRYALPLICSACVIATCVLAGMVRHYQLKEARGLAYSTAIIECANGRAFAIGRRIVTCIVVDTE